MASGHDSDCGFSVGVSGSVSHRKKCDIGRGKFLANNDSDVHSSPGLFPLHSPGFSSTPIAPASSAPRHQDVTIEALGDLITRLAHQIGDSIAVRLSTHNASVGSQSFLPDHQTTDTPVSSDLDLSKVKVVVQPDIKEPPVFRGDQSDKCSIHEWEELMKLYMRKKGYPTHEQYEEILGKLMSKAKDIVKVTLRSNPALDPKQDPSIVFDILKQNFSELTYSCMPLADFYNTVPRTGEDAMDFWIRLNKAVDVADECLRRQGRKIENPSLEVVMMFIKHCPDSGLGRVFKLKPAEKWTAGEVQERLDDFQRDQKARRNANQPVNLMSRSVTACTQTSHELQVACTQVDQLSLTSSPASTPTLEEPSLHKMIGMLDRVLSLNTQTTTFPHNQSLVQNPSRSHVYHGGACKVCGSSTHSTHAHCMRDNLCLQCFAHGHIKRDCAARSRPGPPGTQPHRSHLN